MKEKFFLLLFVIFLMWCSFIPGYIFEINIKVTYIVLIVFLYALFCCKNTRNQFVRTKDIPYWVFIFSLLISYIFSVNRYISFYNYFYIIIIPAFVYPFVKNVPIKKYKYTIADAFCLVGIVVALFGLLEFATKYNIIYEVFLSTPYYERYLNCSRIMSTQYHPAVLATYFMLILPFSIFLLFNNRNKTELLLGVISSMIILGGIILTFTRAVFVATFILLSIYLLVRHRKIYFIFLSFLILFLILTIPITKHFQTFKTFERFDITSPKQERAIMYRLKRFPTAFKIWKLQPVTGVGIGNFRYLFDKYHSEGGVEYEFKIPDNMYLSILSETGILGLLTLVYLVFSTIILAYKKIKVLVSSDKQFLLLILCGFIGYLINMLSYDMFYWHMPLYFFSLYIGIIKSYL